MKKVKPPRQPAEFDLYGNPNDRRHPFNYRTFLEETGKKPADGMEDSQMYDRLLEPIPLPSEKKSDPEGQAPEVRRQRKGK